MHYNYRCDCLTKGCGRLTLKVTNRKQQPEMNNETVKAALTAYRHALRASRVAFNNDLRTLTAARLKMRQGMINPPNPDMSPKEQVQFMEDVAKILRQNVVQGTKLPQTKDGKDVYQLNIHPDTELGDNESIKQKTKFKSFTLKKPCH